MLEEVRTAALQQVRSSRRLRSAHSSCQNNASTWIPQLLSGRGQSVRHMLHRFRVPEDQLNRQEMFEILSFTGGPLMNELEKASRKGAAIVMDVR